MIISIFLCYIENMIPKENDMIRFTVGAPNNPQSLVWRLWTTGDSFYVGAKNGDDFFKVSFKGEEQWRIAYVKALNQNDSSDDNIIYSWSKPASTTPEFIHCASIVIQQKEIGTSSIRNKAEDARIKWINESQTGKAIVFKIILSWPRMKRLELGGIMKEGDVLIGNIKKQNGEKIWLLANELVLSPEQHNAINSLEIKGQNDKSSKIVIMTELNISIAGNPTIFDVSI
jgi:hypothetical protein